jgi:hypothetical protein
MHRTDILNQIMSALSKLYSFQINEFWDAYVLRKAP